MALLEEVGNNAERFTEEIYYMCRIHRMRYIEAITLFIEEHEMDFQDVIPLIGSTLKEKLRIEGEKRRSVSKEHNTSSLF